MARKIVITPDQIYRGVTRKWIEQEFSDLKWFNFRGPGGYVAERCTIFLVPVDGEWRYSSHPNRKYDVLYFGVNVAKTLLGRTIPTALDARRR